MAKNTKNKRLLIVFVALVALAIVIFTNKNSKKESSFNKQLVEITSDDITQLKLYPKMLKGAEVSISKEGDQWMISDGTNSYKANNNSINGMLSSLENLEAQSLVSNSKDKWDEYEVSDSLAACRVEAYNGSKKEADVLIGKFKFSQPRNMSTYVRLNGKKQTYKVDGFLSSTFNRKINDLRDRTILKDLTTNWSKITFDYPADSSFVITKENLKWMVDGVLADSVSMAGYINTMKNINGINISDITPGGPVLYQVTIDRENLSSVTIQVKQNGEQKMITSLENKDVWFTDKSIIDKIFVPKSKFVIK